MSNHLIPRPSAALSEQDKIQRLVNDFFAGRKDTTLNTYRQGLRHFAAFLGVASVEDAANVLVGSAPGDANHLVLSFKADMVAQNLAGNTINSRLSALRSLIRLARRIGMVTWTLDIDNARCRRHRDTAGPGLDVCHRMLVEITNRITGPPEGRIKALRNRAILRLLFDLALRRSSVVVLDLADVDLQAGAIRVWGKGEGDEERESRPLPGPTVEALREWIEVRGDQAGPLFVALDPNTHGSRLTGASVWRLVRKIADAIGESAWPHGLRHTSITEVVDRSRDVRLGRIHARHSDLRTTQSYLDNLESRELDVQATSIAATSLGHVQIEPE